MTLEIKYHHLTNHNLFAKLPREQVSELCDYTKVRIAHKGESFFYGEGEAHKIYFLIKGKVKICEIDEKGDEQIKEVLKADDLFGQILSVKIFNTTEFAKVLSYDAVVCEFRFDEFENIIRRNPELGINFTKQVWGKLKRAEMRYRNLASMDVRARLNDFIKDMAIKEGKDEDGSLKIKNYLTHNDIAALINTSRQTVTTLLNEMKDSGYLNYSRSEFVINNLAAIN